jgi:hypothetical protein
MSGIQLGTGAVITERFTVNGVLTDGTTVTFTLTDPNGDMAVFVDGADPEVTHPSVGVYVLTLDPSQVAVVGDWFYEAVSTGTVEATSRGTFPVYDPSGERSGARTSTGPCQAWVDSQDVAGQAGNPVDANDVPVDLIQYAIEASEILYMLSGKQFPGTCEKTVRPPCATDRFGCSTQVLSRGHLINWDGSTWNGSPCGCQALSRVLLSGYPVWEITQVKIDGVVVDPSEYRLDDYRWLIRKGDPVTGAANRWPACQRLDLDDTENGTFAVTYKFGAEPPLIGKAAAAELAAQLYKAANGQECSLPSGTTRVVRQGIVIELLAFSAWGLQDGIWRTGLKAVDAFLNTYNPTNARRRPVFWSPASTLRYARPVGSSGGT